MESGGRECELVQLLEGAGFDHPIPGFGASDCSSGCRSHLLRFQGGLGACVEVVASAFRAGGLEPKLVKV